MVFCSDILLIFHSFVISRSFLSVRVFRLRYYWLFPLGSLVWELSFVIYPWGSFVEGLLFGVLRVGPFFDLFVGFISLGVFRWRSFVWELSLRILCLEALVCDLLFGVLEWGLVRDLAFGIFRAGSSVL